MSEDRLDYTVLVSLMSREEAEVASAALRADGVDAFIGNSNHAYTEWLLVPAFNGLQILVPRRKLTEARSLLRERIKENSAADDVERLSRNDYWKAWLMLALMFSPFLLLLALGGQSNAVDWVYGNSLP